MDIFCKLTANGVLLNVNSSKVLLILRIYMGDPNVCGRPGTYCNGENMVVVSEGRRNLLVFDG